MTDRLTQAEMTADLGASYNEALKAMRSGKPDEYSAFLAGKAAVPLATGIEAEISERLFDFQREATAFCLRQGRAGLFLDTGLGKTLCELEFSRNAAEATNGRALILTPLAVARQIEREARRFGYEAKVIREQSEAADGISICNYDRLDKLDPDAFGSVALDESSILKSFDGKTQKALTQMFASHRFRLSATATPAPNDHMEIGQQAAFLSVMTANEMLSRFFINDTSTASQKWRLKGHAERAFWDWMASWARMAQTPEDLGFDGSRFILSPMKVVRHKTEEHVKAHGSLFVEELSATSLHEVKRQTIAARADAAARIVGSQPDEAWVIWCDTNYESDALADAVPQAIEVRGDQSIEEKEEKLAAFADGRSPILITKPSLTGFGLNWQHCARMIFVGRSFSYEAWYQAVRRCWRFGQTREVEAHLIVADGEDQIGRVIDRKSGDHQRMKRAMAEAMQRANGRSARRRVEYTATHRGRLPAWL